MTVFEKVDPIVKMVVLKYQEDIREDPQVCSLKFRFPSTCQVSELISLAFFGTQF